MVKKVSIVLSLIFAVVLSIALRISWSQCWIPLLTFVGSYFLCLGFFLLFCLILSLFVPKGKTYKTQSKFVNALVLLTMEMLMDVGHVKVKTTGLENIPHNQKYMLVYNHTSNFDPIVQSVLLKKDNLIHVSKPENFKIPLAGPMVRRNCYLSLNRHNDREALKTIMEAASFIKQQKYCVSISPEGTRNKDDVSQLLPFRAGAFQMAFMAKCPIVVC